MLQNIRPSTAGGNNDTSRNIDDTHNSLMRIDEKPKRNIKTANPSARKPSGESKNNNSNIFFLSKNRA